MERALYFDTQVIKHTGGDPQSFGAVPGRCSRSAQAVRAACSGRSGTVPGRCFRSAQAAWAVGADRNGTAPGRCSWSAWAVWAVGADRNGAAPGRCSRSPQAARVVCAGRFGTAPKGQGGVRTRGSEEDIRDSAGVRPQGIAKAESARRSPPESGPSDRCRKDIQSGTAPEQKEETSVCFDGGIVPLCGHTCLGRKTWFPSA